MSSFGGQQPKQYGLIKKPASSNQPKGMVLASNKRPVLFNNDDDDIDDIDDGNNSNAIKRANQFIVSSKSTQQKSSTVDDDIAIYDYDGQYDSFKSNDTTSNHPLLSEGTSNLTKSKPKYIENIIATSKIREKEQERMYERKLMRERKKEDELYGDTEKFMTSAYKKKLEDEKKWEYEDKLIDIVEQKTDYRSKGMHGFYSNLMSKNVATGADVSSNALSAYTAGSSRQNQLDNDNYKIKDETATKIDNDNNNDVNQKRSSNEINVENNEDMSKRPRIETSDKPSSIAKEDNDTNSTNQISKEDVILSARERYLARKNKSS